MSSLGSLEISLDHPICYLTMVIKGLHSWDRTCSNPSHAQEVVLGLEPLVIALFLEQFGAVSRKQLQPKMSLHNGDLHVNELKFLEHGKEYGLYFHGN